MLPHTRSVLVVCDHRPVSIICTGICTKPLQLPFQASAPLAISAKRLAIKRCCRDMRIAAATVGRWLLLHRTSYSGKPTLYLTIHCHSQDLVSPYLSGAVRSLLAFINFILVWSIPLLICLTGDFSCSHSEWFTRHKCHFLSNVFPPGNVYDFIFRGRFIYFLPVDLQISYQNTFSCSLRTFPPCFELMFIVLNSRIPLQIPFMLWDTLIIITVDAVCPAGVCGWYLIADWQTRPVIRGCSSCQSKRASAVVSLVWLLRVGHHRNVHAPAQLPLILFVRD